METFLLGKNGAVYLMLGKSGVAAEELRKKWCCSG